MARKLTKDLLSLKMDLFQKGIKQRQIADAVGLSTATISDYLNGRRPLSGDKAADITAIGSLAAEVLAAAVIRAVEAACPAGGCPAARDVASGCVDSDRK